MGEDDAFKAVAFACFNARIFQEHNPKEPNGKSGPSNRMGGQVDKRSESLRLAATEGPSKLERTNKVQGRPCLFRKVVPKTVPLSVMEAQQEHHAMSGIV